MSVYIWIDGSWKLGGKWNFIAEMQLAQFSFRSRQPRERERAFENFQQLNWFTRFCVHCYYYYIAANMNLMASFLLLAQKSFKSGFNRWRILYTAARWHENVQHPRALNHAQWIQVENFVRQARSSCVIMWMKPIVDCVLCWQISKCSPLITIQAYYITQSIVWPAIIEHSFIFSGICVETKATNSTNHSSPYIHAQVHISIEILQNTQHIQKKRLHRLSYCLSCSLSSAFNWIQRIIYPNTKQTRLTRLSDIEFPLSSHNWMYAISSRTSPIQRLQMATPSKQNQMAWYDVIYLSWH